MNRWVSSIELNPSALASLGKRDLAAALCPQVLTGASFAEPGQPGERLDTFFERLAGLFESAPAVISQDRVWTYRELDEQANRFARVLMDRGLRPGGRAGLLLDRSAETYIAILAVMKAGAAFVPLAPAFPDERISMIVEDAGVSLIVTDAGYAARMEGLPVPHVLIGAAAPEVMAKSSAPLLPRREPSVSGDICYILYTSGTTGRPKGVAVSHRSICNFVRVAAASYGYRPADRVYQGMTIAFDFSVEEIWVPFAAGSAIVPAPGPLTLVGEELADFLRANGVTCMACSPTLLSSMESEVPRLRLLLVGGEACPQQMVERWSKPGRRILNTYGPTEATVTATMSVLTPGRPVTIGKPLPTYSIAILDPEQPALAAPGELGEIGIAGIGLAAGYLNRPELTDEKFIPDFLGLPDNPSKRIYRTGDLGRIGADGEIEYHGRIDTQVKIRGYRIELAEIEAVLLDHPAIAQAAVTTWEPDPGRVEIAGYYALKTGAPQLTRAGLTAELKRRLPDYMVPSALEEVPAIPMTVAGKVDLRQLPKPSRLYLAADRRVVAPRDAGEQFLADALAQVLGAGNISVDDHFFEDLGANSLLMARFCARIRTRKEWAAASMRDIYLHPSVARLAKHLHVPQGEAQPVHETACVHRASNFAYWACGSAQLLFYGLYAFAGVWALNLGLNWVYESLDDLAQLYLRSLLFWAALFFGTTAVSIAGKWALAGRWEPGKFPIWGLAYYRFWVVKTLVQSAPAVAFRGGPLYNLYLRLLGARVGPGAVIKCHSVPVCTDLVSIGANTIIRKESTVLSYRAQSGYIHVGPVTVGRDAFAGVGSVLDIGTKIGDGAQLGHASSLQTGQSIPDGERWHGSPAVPATANYCNVRDPGASKLRPILFETFRLLMLFAILTPLPFLLFHGYRGIAGGGYQETLGNIAIWTAAGLFGFIAAALLAAVAVPRLCRPFLKPGQTYHLYGFRYWLYTLSEVASNSRFLNLLFGDSSAIIHYIRAIGWKLNRVVQTGSNFGTNQQHEFPLLCEIGSETMVSDGLFMINSHKSAAAFRLEHTKIGESNFLGNNIYYPPDGRTGANCLLGTKVMIPTDGPVRENVGLLGSPCFEIPRMVSRDKELLDAFDEGERRRCVKSKNLHNAVTALLFLAAHWLMLFATLAIWDRALSHYAGWEEVSLFAASVLTAAIAIPYYALLERGSLGFRRLKPQVMTIYDPAFWRHERHWKLSDSPIAGLFGGTPFRPVILRLLGVKVGARVFDAGSNLTERSLVEIGDDATLNEGCVVQAHSLEEGAFKSDYIRIGAGCTLGPAAFIHYGVVMKEGSAADADSFVMKGEVLEPDSIWRGNPAKPHRFIAPARAEGAAAEICLVPVADHNQAPVLALELSGDQTELIASNLESLKEAGFNGDARPRAIVAGNRIVGFLMYEAPEDDDEARIYRFMIGHAEQGKGYGKSALHQALGEIATLGHVRRVSICYTPENVAARSIYLSAGFVERGLDEDGEMIADIALPGQVNGR